MQVMEKIQRCHDQGRFDPVMRVRALGRPARGALFAGRLRPLPCPPRPRPTDHGA